jgi:D-alanyl-D-alanine carboxypeptidase/D-alanyl-D-alanine-endopeptidase (penicillin-binding protein 4)
MKLKHAITLAALMAVAASTGNAQSAPGLSAKLAEIVKRPELVHATFGVAAYDLDAKRLVFGLNAEQLFTPGSTTKLLTMGTALGLLGADYRFHTPVYRTGPIDHGVLKGDLVIVASGDPNLSGRILGDTLGFANEDHSYTGGGDSTSRLIGDPLMVMREFASQIAAKGITQIDGRVLVDASLFPPGDRELGTGVVISPIVVNDNVVDLEVRPGAKAGDPATIRVSPELGLFKLVNEVVTGAPHSVPTLHRMISRDSTRAVTVRVTGSLAADGTPSIMDVVVDDPSELAVRAFTAALRDRGISVRGDSYGPTTSHADSMRVAEHVSLPLAEEIKVTLKVSQNLHASMMPYVLGAIAGHTSGHGALEAGFLAEHDFLQRAGLDLIAAAQGDGAGGAPGAFYSPEFMVQYLAYMASRPDTAVFRRALPILGRDGTLWNIQPDSPAAGKVFAKTGTFALFDPLNRRTIITGKGLAGYMTTSTGKRLAFAIYANRIPFPPNYQGQATLLVGQALGEIAAAMWDAPLM